MNINNVKNFWEANPCNSKLSENKDRKKYFEEVTTRRYQREPHIPEIAKFEEYKDCDVLEIGCGIGIDGIQFAKNGAHYVAFDLTKAAIEITREHFRLFGFHGKFEVGNAEKMPFPNETFDHIYSFGVIMCTPNPEAVVQEMHRVLRPGGTFCVMIYNKPSINYYIEIMFLRKLFRYLLYPSFMPALISKIFGFDEWKLQEHTAIMLKKGKLSKQEWISINTDGPKCPLSRVYSREDALQLFGKFKNLKMEIHQFDKSHWSFIGELLPESVRRWLGSNWGWHRIVYGSKPV